MTIYIRIKELDVPIELHSTKSALKYLKHHSDTCYRVGVQLFEKGPIEWYTVLLFKQLSGRWKK